MPRGAFSETNLKLLSIYTLIIFPTRFQQQINFIQIPVSWSSRSSTGRTGYDSKSISLFKQVYRFRCIISEVSDFHPTGRRSAFHLYRGVSWPASRRPRKKAFSDYLYNTSYHLKYQVLSHLGIPMRMEMR